jgi:hypothetical protein
MTCIVGIADGMGRVWMGGDRAAVADGHYVTRVAAPKVFQRGQYLIGYTSSFRMGQLIEHVVDLPTPPASNIDRFMVTDFIEKVRSCMKAGGYAKVDSNRETAGCFLVGVAGLLFRADDDFNITRPLCGYDAIGSGVSVARGSLHSTAELITNHEMRVRLALRAAATHAAGVYDPFDVVSLQADEAMP